MQFIVKVMKDDEPVVDLIIDARDELAARATVARDGFAVLSARARGPLAHLRRARRVAFPTPIFAVELLTLLRAGLNVVEATSALSKKDNPPHYRVALERIVGALRVGHTLSTALSNLEEGLPLVFIATVRASETTSDLVPALARYVEYEQQVSALRRKILNATIYPAVLIGVAFLVILFLVLYVIPRFAQAYAEISTELPFFSKALLGLGTTVSAHPAVVTMVILSLAGLGALATRGRKTRAALFAQLLRIPTLGARVRLFHLARLYRTLGMLLGSGVPMLSALAIAKTILPLSMSAQADRAGRLLSEGQSISSAMREASLTSPIADQMLAVGERSGDMGAMMERIAEFCDDEMSRWLDVAMRLFEPILMSVIGVVVGLVVVLMYMPIFELASSVQ